MVEIELTKDHALVLGAVVASFLVHGFYMPSGMIKARKEYGVKHPTHYATSSEIADEKQRDRYNSAIRGYMNSIEYLPTMLSLLACASLQHPRTAGVFGMVYVVGRILYFAGYSSKGPRGRSSGFIIASLATFGLAGVTIKTIVSLLT